jgi:hypothetical protein
LRAEINGFIDRQPIADRMRHGLQKTVGARLVGPPESFVQIVDLDMSQLDGMIEAFQSDGTHDVALFFLSINIYAA